jgi:6-phosphogluconolactonase
MTEFVALPDRGALAERSALLIQTALRKRLEAMGSASLVLSGGRTPGPTYTQLSTTDLDWRNVTATLSDDRDVPSASPYSNARLVRETLLVNRAARARFVALAPGALDPSLLPLGVTVLGMGEDGHVASLFPGVEGLDDALDPAAAPACVRMTPDPLPAEAPYPRLTLNLAALLASVSIVLLLAGETKRRVYEGARQGADMRAMPVRAIVNQSIVPVTVFWAP